MDNSQPLDFGQPDGAHPLAKVNVPGCGCIKLFAVKYSAHFWNVQSLSSVNLTVWDAGSPKQKDTM
jgi:hypothetical protein